MKYFKLFEDFKDVIIFNKIRERYFTSPVIDFSYKQRDGYRLSNNKVIFGTVLTYKSILNNLLYFSS